MSLIIDNDKLVIILINFLTSIYNYLFITIRMNLSDLNYLI